MVGGKKMKLNIGSQWLEKTIDNRNISVLYLSKSIQYSQATKYEIIERYWTVVKELNAARDYHTKWSHKVKDKYHMISLKYEQMNLSTKQKQIHKHREQTCGWGGGGGKERNGLGVWGWQMQNITFKMDKQQGLSV